VSKVPVVSNVVRSIASPSPARARSGGGAGSGSSSGGGVTTGGSQERSIAGVASTGAGSGASVAVSRAAAAGAGRSRRSARAKASAAKPPSRRERRHRRERRLRRAVARLSGCLSAIGALQRQVLVLRAGVGPGAPLSRRAMAARLDAGVQQVARAERRGLRELRDAARAGGCQSQPAGVSAGSSAPTARRDGGGGIVLAAYTDPRQAQTGDSQAGRRPAGGEGASRSGPLNPPAALISPAEGGAGPPLLLLMAVTFLTGFAAVWTRERRRLR
jgi:hypothetical protein